MAGMPQIVPTEYGYEIYYEKYKDDSRFSFIPLENKGHNYFNDDTYRNEFNAKFDEWLKTLDYDYNTEENRERFSEDKAKYIYIKTLTGKNGIIHWIWSCSRILLGFMMDIYIN